MRKIEESFVGNELINRDLLDSQNDRTLTDILSQDGARLFILVVRKNPLLRGLHHDLDSRVLFKDLPDIAGGEGSSALPHALVLPANPNISGVLHGLVFKIKLAKM